MATANEILEKHIDKENWHLIENVGLTFKDNSLLKIGTLHTESLYRTYYFTIKFINSQKVNLKIKFNQKNEYEKNIDYMNYLLHYTI